MFAGRGWPRQTGKFVWTAGKRNWRVGGCVQGCRLDEISSILQCTSEAILYRLNCGSWQCGVEGLGSVLSIYNLYLCFRLLHKIIDVPLV